MMKMALLNILEMEDDLSNLGESADSLVKQAGLYGKIGSLHEELKDKPKAAEAYKKAIETLENAPAKDETRKQLASLYIALGCLQELPEAEDTNLMGEETFEGYGGVWRMAGKIIKGSVEMGLTVSLGGIHGIEAIVDAYDDTSSERHILYYASLDGHILNDCGWIYIKLVGGLYEKIIEVNTDHGPDSIALKIPYYSLGIPLAIALLVIDASVATAASLGYIALSIGLGAATAVAGTAASILYGGATMSSIALYRAGKSAYNKISGSGKVDNTRNKNVSTI